MHYGLPTLYNFTNLSKKIPRLFKCCQRLKQVKVCQTSASAVVHVRLWRTSLACKSHRGPRCRERPFWIVKDTEARKGEPPPPSPLCDCVGEIRLRSKSRTWHLTQRRAAWHGLSATRRGERGRRRRGDSWCENVIVWKVKNLLTAHGKGRRNNGIKKVIAWFYKSNIHVQLVNADMIALLFSSELKGRRFKPRACFVCLRWIHFPRGHRSKAAVKR